eukprot:CAMPEP_0172160628 /NCGR_PEP_ID=MMETSP1050-20130122/5663_1 /TAXON_ID=233186 /ORGANISM="Cryptomonas curvata, Strain CCAP979/52" /LENGTH=70 /DNA_ID=CAMNT_0012830411 /DNA_START=140 /DNA_END=349 /DNA_ORIENTATION=+
MALTEVEQGCPWQLDDFIRCVRDNRIGWQGDCAIPQNQLQACAQGVLGNRMGLFRPALSRPEGLIAAAQA